MLKELGEHTMLLCYSLSSACHVRLLEALELFLLGWILEKKGLWCTLAVALHPY